MENEKDGYIEITATSGFGQIDNIQMLWGADITDYDNDGLPDIFVASSDFSRLTEAPTEFPLMLYKQNQKGNFSDKSIQYGLPQQTMGRVAISYDINSDGIEDHLASSADVWHMSLYRMDVPKRTGLKSKPQKEVLYK